MLTGVLLMRRLPIDAWRRRAGPRRVGGHPKEEFDVKNSQVAILCAAILAGALIVAGTNVWLVPLDRPDAAAATAVGEAAPAPASGRSSR